MLNRLRKGDDLLGKAALIFIVGFAVRFVAAVVTTLTTLNPDSTADAGGFASTAETIARGVREGHPYQYIDGSANLFPLLIPAIKVDIYQLWGSFLAPFWLLPGPSGLYARLGNAFLGAFAVYNIYLIARYYHSHSAGIFAATPMIFYPSIVAVQSTLLREAIILFGITTATRLLTVPTEQRSRRFIYASAGFLLYVAILLRHDNIIIYAAALFAAIAVYAVESGWISKRTIGIGTIFSPAAFILSLPFIRDGIGLLARTRELRASGRAVYLPNTIPRTVIELIAFSWVGAAYFLYAPFPWMIETIPDILVSMEGIISLGFTVAAIWGVRSFGQQNAPATIGMLVGLTVAVVLYGVGTANYGTGMRHRQMFLWVIFLFGGIGIAEHVKFVWARKRTDNTASETETKTHNSGSD